MLGLLGPCRILAPWLILGSGLILGLSGKRNHRRAEQAEESDAHDQLRHARSLLSRES